MLSTAYWNPIGSDRIIQVGAVAANGSGGAAEKLQVVFTQSDVFMDLTPGTFVYSSSFKRPTPDVEMQPQRQVPIINPFHKTKYIIKAY